ncbi:uncharacterized protein LOC110628454 isoform X3 [Manihot esculenta]|uniref:uncharacterized protein LOC110628454 isoform X3 n=1 Tax=Manihot esculenta TaxID=3983 RepID=UPI001CC3FE82|nr:uncharacterized protein LOC110628454 isoform X3 [Manihot esculenta]
MSLAKLNSGPPHSPSDYNVEYRAIADDAWYSVRAVLDGEKLTVKYCNFSDDHDNVFEPQYFKSVVEIEEFVNRFRPVSNQLQDRDCKNVAEGAVVCASHSFSDLDVRFHDAVIDDVFHKNHSFVNGEEQCMCTFVVIWQHGPGAGCLANKKIENICIVRSNAELDPNVDIFSKIVREKLESAAYCNGTIHGEIASLPMKLGSTCAQRFYQETNCASQSTRNRWSYEEIERICHHTQRIKEESDIGGIENHYVVLIDNVDKDMSPSTITEFIHRQTSISVRVFVLPSSTAETFTKGAIVLDSKKNLQKLCEFLDSPNHIIMSRRGRPWVIADKLNRHDKYMVPLGNLMPKYQNKLQHRKIGITNDLKVVYSGSEEYRTAKRLRDLFMEFSEHQQRLHKRLALEEQMILQPSLTV